MPCGQLLRLYPTCLLHNLRHEIFLCSLVTKVFLLVIKIFPLVTKVFPLITYVFPSVSKVFPLVTKVLVELIELIEFKPKL